MVGNGQLVGCLVLMAPETLLTITLDEVARTIQKVQTTERLLN